jgi:hypothetical protein
VPHESDFRLPERVGLCPQHGDEFYVPHDGRCPAVGCTHELVMYERAEPSPAMKRLTTYAMLGHGVGRE